MKVLVTGVSGQLGYDVCRRLDMLGIENRGVSSREMDITDREAVLEYLRTYAPDALIHCAAYTKVDLAEDEAEKCWSVNVDGSRNLALACREIGAKMLQVSTDYVFPGHGETVYEPGDPVGPLGMYGRSKLGGELAVQSLLEKYFIVRVSWVFGINGGNFVKTMLRLGQTRDELTVVCDQIGSPSYTSDLSVLLCDMIQTEKYGVYHASNEGLCSWAEFAEEIFRASGMNTAVRHIPSSEYPTKALRPLNSRMSKDCLDQAGFDRLPHWKDALHRYLRELEREQSK